MKESCFDSKYVGELITMDEKLKEFYFENIQNHNYDIIKTFPLIGLAVYGSIISDPFINVENESIKDIIIHLLDYYEKYLELDSFKIWSKDYIDIINSEKNITDEFIEETLLMSDIFYLKSRSSSNVENYKMYWNFMCLIVCLFPKEVFGVVEVNRLKHIDYKTLHDVLLFNKPSMNLQTSFINDVVNFTTKCFKKMSTILALQEKPWFFSERWNIEIPNYFAVTILLTIYRSSDLDIGKIIYNSLK